MQRTVIVDPANDSREALSNILRGIDSVWLEAECSRYEYCLDVIQQSPPDLILIGIDNDPEQGIELIRLISRTHPNANVIALSGRADGQMVAEVFKGGAKDFVALPATYEKILDSINRIGTRGTDSRRCQVYAFCGARGGVGSTSVAVNLGCILAAMAEGGDAANRNSVGLIDLDLIMGDADVYVDVSPDYTLADVVGSIDRIDFQLLKRSLCKHRSGLYLLPHPVQIEEASFIHEEHIKRVINLMKSMCTHMILDLSKSYRPIDQVALEAADLIFLITQLDISNLRNVVRFMMLLDNQPKIADKVRIIANRVGSDDNEITVARAEETIGREIFFQIPNDSKTMLAARNSGVPLIEHAPKSKIYHSMVQLADAIVSNNGQKPMGKPVKKAEAKKAGWLPWGG